VRYLVTAAVTAAVFSHRCDIKSRVRYLITGVVFILSRVRFLVTAAIAVAVLRHGCGIYLVTAGVFSHGCDNGCSS